MPKHTHEFRDPIHHFIRVSTRERGVIDSSPVQRLRDIHQLATSYLVYPSATHKRFEHALGVLELASRIFDSITQEDKRHSDLPPDLLDLLFHPGRNDDRAYWRQVLRLAALTHDIGHPVFSHSTEGLFPPGFKGHEQLTVELIRNSPELIGHWNGDGGLPGGNVPINSEHISKLAVGREKIGLGANGETINFSDWEAVLSELIVGDAFGSDRGDYLLRDSYHLGVAYGHYDVHRLVDSLRVLPHADPTKPGDNGKPSIEPAFGIEEGSIPAAESIALARYSMFSQVYCHPVRRIFDIHLQDFISAWKKMGMPTTLEEHLRLTDAEVLSEIHRAALDPEHPGHDPAERIVKRDHFRLAWSKNADDQAINKNAFDVIFEAASRKFGKANVRKDAYRKPMKINFPVLRSDGKVVGVHDISPLTSQIPPVSVEYIFVRSELKPRFDDWFNKQRKRILNRKPKEIKALAEEEQAG